MLLLFFLMIMKQHGRNAAVLGWAAAVQGWVAPGVL